MNAITSGLGDCGTSPCTWWDEVWVRDDCLAYLQTCNPTDPRVVGMQSGFVAGVTAEAGDVLSAAGQQLGKAGAKTLSDLLSGLFINADGTPNMTTIVIAGAAAYVLLGMGRR